MTLVHSPAEQRKQEGETQSGEIWKGNGNSKANGPKGTPKQNTKQKRRANGVFF